MSEVIQNGLKDSLKIIEGIHKIIDESISEDIAWRVTEGSCREFLE